MSGLAILNFLVAALELCVPSYALRLVRRFGANQVGSFVIVAFASLAVVHLLNPIKTGPGSDLALSLVYGGASVLLLIGMGHTETVCRERQQAVVDEQKLRLELDQAARERGEELVKVRQELAQEIVRLQQQVETLSASERQYRLLFTQNPHPMWIFDLRTGRILAGNLAALAQYGFAQREFLALTAKDLLSREAARSFLTDSARPCSSPENRGVWRHRRKDRTTLDVEVTAVDLRFGDCPARLVFAEDLGPRLSREAALCESERTRLLRQVTEGVAHHFGQILNIVEAQATNLPGPEDNESAARAAQQILGETRRGTALVRQMLAVGGCEGIQPEPVDLNGFVQEKEPLLRRLVGERIALNVQLGESLAPALADRRVLELALVNLVLNAREALPHGGAIDIQTQSAWFDSGSAARPGQHVQLIVRDNGCGMAAEVQQHLFEPFFTTCTDRNAMGLGLATVHGGVRQHGGWIECATRPQEGTEFRLFFSCAPLPVTGIVDSVPAAPPAPRETILLVDPDDRVRDLARHILQRDGYHVIEADTPATAALLLEAQGKCVDILLTDLNFPSGHSGRELAEQVREFNPNLRVIYASRPLSAEDTTPEILEEARLLLKPYTPERLLRSVRSSLSKQDSAPV